MREHSERRVLRAILGLSLLAAASPSAADAVGRGGLDELPDESGLYTFDVGPGGQATNFRKVDGPIDLDRLPVDLSATDWTKNPFAEPGSARPPVSILAIPSTMLEGQPALTAAPASPASALPVPPATAGIVPLATRTGSKVGTAAKSAGVKSSRSSLPTPAPEPSALALLGLAFAATVARRAHRLRCGRA